MPPVHVEIGASDTQRALSLGDSSAGSSRSSRAARPSTSATRTSEDTGGAWTAAVRASTTTSTTFAQAPTACASSAVGGRAAPVPGMGWFATCTDLEGNAFGLWKNDPNAWWLERDVVRPDGHPGQCPSGAARIAATTAAVETTVGGSPTPSRRRARPPPPRSTPPRQRAGRRARSGSGSP